MATGRQMNRLDGSQSPYLQSHSDQPVDWYPWGEEAFAEAARRDLPVFISIGYQTCHWCHVMARETFSNPLVGEYINKRFISIKVDREEHPDVDAAYLAQAVAFGDKLGWPLNVFADSQGVAYFAATYLPPVTRMKQPSFLEVAKTLSRAWNKKRSEVRASTRALKEAVHEAALVNARTGIEQFPDQARLAKAAMELMSQEDKMYGGLGTGPKFPMAPALRFLLSQEGLGNEEAGLAGRRILASYAPSPLRDPVEGGFFRYATNRDFTSPHHERMLNDNASLLTAYAMAGSLDVAAGIVSFFRNQLLGEGALASAQDSESSVDGQPNDGGYYEADASTRSTLEPPQLDDKVVIAWNGLALEALAHAHRGGVAGDPGGLGTDIATWLIDHHIKDDGSVIRMSRNGAHSSAVATLADYGGLALGLIELGLATQRADFVAKGRDVLDYVMVRGTNIEQDPVLAARGLGWTPDISEGVNPNGLSLLALASIRLAALTGKEAYREYAWFLVSPLMKQALAMPQGMGALLSALSELATRAREVIVIDDGDSTLSDMAKNYQRTGTVVVTANSAQAQQFLDSGFNLFESRTSGLRATAYVCTEGVCALPATTPEEFARQLED